MTILIHADGCPGVSDVMKNKTSCRTLHSQLTARGADCALEWNSGGHFKDADLRTAKAFRWAMEENR